jgi:hypothetical protein
MFRKSGWTVLVLLGLTSVAIPAAQGSVVYTLNQSASFGSGPFGTVTLDQTSSTLVTITETLAPGVNWAGTGAGEALEFNILGNPAISIAIAPANVADFSAGVGGSSASPFGNFEYFIHCKTCQGGSGPTGTLTFTVSLVPSGTLSISSFQVLSAAPPHGDTPAYFASDICFESKLPGACTANVGSTTFTNSTVPEPVTSGLVATGLVSLFFLRRRTAAKRTV